MNHVRSLILVFLAAVGVSCGNPKRQEVTLLHIGEQAPPVTYEHRLTKDGWLVVSYSGANGTAGDIVFDASKTRLSSNLTEHIFKLADRVQRSSPKSNRLNGTVTKQLTLWHQKDPPGQITLSWSTNQPDANAAELIGLLEANHIGDRPMIPGSTNSAAVVNSLPE